MGSAYTVAHAACLAFMLPEYSRTKAIKTKLPSSEVMLARIDYYMQCILRSLGADLDPEIITHTKPEEQAANLDLDEVKEMLARERKEV